MLWFRHGVVYWTFRVRGGGAKRTIGIKADNPALNDLLVICDCGERWVPVFDNGRPLPAPPDAGVLKPVGAASGAA